MSMFDDNFRQLDGEAFIISRLRAFGRGIYDGDTTPAIRRDRIRDAIILGKLEGMTIGNRARKSESFRDAFERFYGEPLEQQPQKRRERSRAA